MAAKKTTKKKTAKKKSGRSAKKTTTKRNVRRPAKKASKRTAKKATRKTAKEPTKKAAKKKAAKKAKKSAPKPPGKSSKKRNSTATRAAPKASVKSPAAEPSGKKLPGDRSRATSSAPARSMPTTQRSLFDGPGELSREEQPAAAAVAPVSAEEARPPRSRRRGNGPETAHSLASKQREISISEFFTKNRHLLGFDSPAKALLTTIKEGVDNSLDACEEAHILPDLTVEIRQLGEERFCVAVEDNGPGIVRKQIPRIFGKLLYGSKFHSLKQRRGQQGIGISAAGMYGQLTTGRPVRIISRTAPGKEAHYFEVSINTKKNEPVVAVDQVVDWQSSRGTRVEIELTGSYKRGRHSVDAYLEQSAISNPHMQLKYVPPTGEILVIPRVTEELPKEAVEIKPHPYGVELGILLRMMKETKSRNLRGFLVSEFNRVGARVADEIIERSGVPAKRSPKRVDRDQADKIVAAISKVKIQNPPTDCLSPIGEEALLTGLKKRITADFYTSLTRSPAVYRGNPFQIEIALAYGGDLGADELATLYRFANRVPLQYQRSACAITKTVLGTAWKSYGLNQARGALPTAPLAVVVHMASAWVPFTSESKEAIAHYPEIMKEIRLGLQECGRRLSTFIKRGIRMRDEQRKRSYIEKYLPHIGIALQEILGISEKEEEKIVNILKDVLERSRKM